MADFAQMLYGTAENVQKEQGSALATGAQGAASLAMQMEGLQAKQQQLKLDQAKLEETKVSKMYDFLKDAKNYTTAAARSGYLKNAMGYRNAMGLDPSKMPDETIKALGMDENLGRFKALSYAVRAGTMTPATMFGIMNDPQKLSTIQPVPDSMASEPDTEKAYEDYLDRQSNESQARTKAGQQGIQNTQDIRKELTAHPVSKDTFVINPAYDKVKGAFQNKKPTAASDMSGIFAYMKMLDPGSTVRESEYENAAKAGSFGDLVQNTFTKVKSGEMLTPSQRANFAKEARRIYNDQVANQNTVNKQYEGIAKASGVKSEQIFAGTNVRNQESTPGMIKLGNGKEYPEENLRNLLKANPNSQLAPEIKKALGIK